MQGFKDESKKLQRICEESMVNQWREVEEDEEKLLSLTL